MDAGAEDLLDSDVMPKRKRSKRKRKMSKPKGKPNPAASQLARFRWGGKLSEVTASKAGRALAEKGAAKGGKTLAAKLTPEERREAARRAGIASGKARRARGRLIRELREKYGKELAERLAALELEG